MSDNPCDTLQSTPGAAKPRRSILARVLKWTLVSLGIIVATLTLLLALLEFVAKFVSFGYGPTESTELVRFNFIDRTYAVQRNYQPSFFFKDDAHNLGSFSVSALLPDFAPYSRARRDEWFALGKGAPHVSILLRSSWKSMRPDELVRLRLKYAVGPNGQPGPAGLRRYDMREGSPTFFDIVYVPERRGDVILIGCTIHEGEMTGCWMEATYDYAANLEIVFNSHFLPDWRQIMDGTRRLLKKFQTQAH